MRQDRCLRSYQAFYSGKVALNIFIDCKIPVDEIYFHWLDAPSVVMYTLYAAGELATRKNASLIGHCAINPLFLTKS